MSGTIEGHLDAKGMRVALVVSRFNDTITERLCRGAQDCLCRHGCSADNQTIVRVPGAWELPQAAKKLTVSGPGSFDAIIALGALIRGETPHFEVITSAVARGLTQVGLDTGIPVIFGVLTTDTVEQANDRAGTKLGNKGWEAAQSAVEMVHLYRRMA